jgi:hypothetical protein
MDKMGELKDLIEYDGYRDILLEVINDGIGLELFALYVGLKILGTEELIKSGDRLLNDYVEDVRKKVITYS